MKAQHLLLAPLSLVILLTMSPPTWGQENDNATSAYSFGGSCASQGVWTQNALSATQNLRKVALQLKNDPNCTGLSTSLQTAFANLENNIKDASDTDQRTTRLSQIPAELSALTSFAEQSPKSRQKVLKLMMDRSTEGAILSAGVEQDTPGKTRAKKLMDFGSRMSQGTKAGIQVLNQVVDGLPQLSECLMGDGAMALGSYLSATVKIAASFASSGQGSMGSQLATTIEKLTNFARNKKFAEVIRTLNKQEFMTSMSCLMELTSDSYCQAREGMSLLNSSMEIYAMKKVNNKPNVATNPFTGYYILNTHVPNITKWMQKIQVGVDPKLPTDADFSNNISQEVTDFFKTVKDLQAAVNMGIESMKPLSEEQRKTAALNLLVSVSDKMTSGNGNRPGPEQKNFFTTAMDQNKIPFFLIGIKDVPDQVLGVGAGVYKIHYADYLRAKHQKLQEFNSPLALVETIRSNMKQLISEANISAIQYYNQWYIVDKPALVNESLTDVNYSVKDSLKAIQEYLSLAKQRIVKYNGSASSVPILLDTQVRIKKILDVYDEVEARGQKLKGFNGFNLSPKEIQDTADLYEKLVNTVYEQFNVMRSNSGFLANRMVNFVYKDYDLLIKNHEGFTPFQTELFITQKMALFDRMLQLNDGNPARIKTDLTMALRVNSGNLDAIEKLLKDNMVGTIAELKMISDGGSDSTSLVFLNSMKRMFANIRRESSRVTNEAFSNPYSYWKKHSDRYPLRSRVDTITRPQSEYDDAAAVQAQLCIQALAFNDQNALIDVCSGTVLKTPFVNATDHDSSYDELLIAHLDDKDENKNKKPLTLQMKFDRIKAQKKKNEALNHSERVCAFRRYNQKNMVLFMGINKD